MALDPRIEPLVSPLAEQLLPDAYREEGPLLTAFLRAVLEWDETHGSAYHARRLLDYGDVDLVPDALLSHLRAKFLDGVALPPGVDLRRVIKHCLDLFRSRGSERAVDLFFRLAYGTRAEIYRPGVDLMRLSSGAWRRPAYVEVWSPALDPGVLRGRVVTGASSGATAFVDRVTRRVTPSGRVVDALAVSAVRGDFSTGERLAAPGVAVGDRPRVVGSLTSVDVVDGGSGFSVGQVVDLAGAAGGYRGRAVVESVSESGSTALFALGDGGYGYTVNAVALVAQREVTLSGLTPGPGSPRDGGVLRSCLELFEQLTQPLANVAYSSATATPARGDTLTSWVNSAAAGAAAVLSVYASNSVAGHALVTPLSGDLSGATTLYSAGNAYHLSVTSYADATASGNVIGEGSRVTLQLSDLSGNLRAGETITEANSSGGECFSAVVSSFSRAGSNGVAVLISPSIEPETGLPVVGFTSGATGLVASVTRDAGVVAVDNAFVADPLAPARGAVSGAQGVVERVSQGSGAGFSVGMLSYPETVSLNTDRLATYAVTALAATAYGFPAHPSANSASPLALALTFADFTVGRIASLSGYAPGAGYTSAPVARVLEPVALALRKRDWVLAVSSPTAAFSVGEVIAQAATGARGLARAWDGSRMSLERLSLLADFAPGSPVTGQSTGASATVDSVETDTTPRPLDTRGDWAGVSAVVSATIAAGEGVATSLRVVDSGLGFSEGESVAFSSASASGVAEARLGEGLGQGSGFYSDRGGHASSDKRLQDGDYWQDYSYETRVGMSGDKYDAARRQLLHVAGTRAFSSYVLRSVVSSPPDSPGVKVS